MPIGVLMPAEKEPEKSRAAKASTVYKCIMVKCNIDSEVDDKDIHIKIAYNTMDHCVQKYIYSKIHTNTASSLKDFF